MVQDYELFLQICNQRDITPPPEITAAIKIASSTGDLQLSCMSIMIPICEAIAQMLTTSVSIKSVDLSDCMLITKSLQSILKAFCEGTSVVYLNLKGNNISGSITTLLGQVFLQNNTLKQLHMEWNSLGTDLESFTSFCEGLTKNHNLQELNLRYNQLSPLCAEPLSKVVRLNKSLKNLNLAWNTLGLRGGESMLTAVQENKYIGMLDLSGNCIPEETMKAIEKCVGRNRNTRLVYNPGPQDCSINSKLSQEKEERFKKTRFQSNSTSDSDSSVSEIETNHQMKELNRILQERTLAVDLLSKEVSSKTLEIETSRSLIDQLQTELTQMKNSKTSELIELKSIYHDNDEKSQKALKQLEINLEKCTNDKKESQTKLRKYEKDVQKYVLEINFLKDKLLSITEAYEDLLAKDKTEIHRLKREFKEREQRSKIETNLLKTTLKETTQALEDCQMQLKKTRHELREINEIHTIVKSQLKDKEDILYRYSKMEENWKKMKEEKSIIDEKYQDSQRIVNTLQRQVTCLQKELIEPQRRYELVQEELNQEKQTTTRLKEELNDERTRLKQLNSQIEKMNQQIIVLNSQINDTQNEHAETLRERDKRCQEFKDIVAIKERELSESKAEEVQRAGHLYAAFNKYFGSVGHHNPVSS